MKYVVITIGLLLGLVGCTVFCIYGFEALSNGPSFEHPSSYYATIMGLLGMLPFLIGTVLSIFAAKRWWKINLESDLESNSLSDSIDNKKIDASSNDYKVRQFKKRYYLSLLFAAIFMTIIWAVEWKGDTWWPTIPLFLFILLWSWLGSRWLTPYMFKKYLERQ